MPHKSRIWVVDDANSICHLMRHTLATAGYDVEIANNGNEALTLARQHKFDAAFTDINTPEMDGIALIKALRELSGYEHIPILALTMTNTDKIKQTGKAAGATGWINKPVSPPKLLDLLDKFGLTAMPRPGLMV